MASRMTNPTSSIDNKDYHILVVDDDINIVKVLSRILSRQNYQVTISQSTEEARKILEKQKIDIMLLDVHMPVETGFKFCQELRQEPNFQLLPIIFVTAMDKNTGLEEAVSHGGDDYISKPIDKKELSAKVRAFCRIKRLQDIVQEQKANYEREMKTARKVQKLLIPEKEISWNKSQISLFFQPFIQISGDFVDAWVENTKLHLVISDSSGHGPSAALLGAMFKMQLNSLPTDLGLEERVSLLRKNLIQAIPENYSITFFYGILDTDYKLEYINGGNPKPLVCSKEGEIFELPGMSPLIIDLEMVRESNVRQIYLEKGSTLLLYTDGANEALSPEDKMLETKGLIEIFKKTMQNRHTNIIKNIMLEIQNYCGENNPPQDDIAFISVKVEE
ncbi:MAG: SpoIIE family protein phosphatase [Spirochaetota bacterium]